MFHDPKPLENDPAQSAAWNRGRYLVEGAGHCSACHSPRNLMGAEKTGTSAWAGALVDGWWAPALTGTVAAERGWTEESLFTYLRTGHATGIASASGPMGEVVHSLQGAGDADVRAMATYLASMITPVPVPVRTETIPLPGAASRIFRAACSGCHDPGLPGVETAAQVSLSMSAAIRAPRPEPLATVIRDGIETPLSLHLRDMPGFGDELSPGQIDALTHYLRERYAADLPPWRQAAENHSNQ